MTAAPPCPTCGRTHTRCAAHSKQTGGPCGARPVPGGTVCPHHGGAAKQVKADHKWSCYDAGDDVSFNDRQD